MSSKPHAPKLSLVTQSKTDTAVSGFGPLSVQGWFQRLWKNRIRTQHDRFDLTVNAGIVQGCVNDHFKYVVLVNGEEGSPVEKHFTHLGYQVFLVPAFNIKAFNNVVVQVLEIRISKTPQSTRSSHSAQQAA